MNVYIEILEISPRIKYIKNNPTETLSLLLNSGSNSLKINDLEKAIKEQQKINLLISPRSAIKLSLIRNNTTVIGITEFMPANETKWLNIKESKNNYRNENLLTISNQKVKNDCLNIENYNEKYNNYYLYTIKNTTIDTNSSIQKYNQKSTINLGDTCINNIKIKILMRIEPKPGKKVNKNIKSSTSLTRGNSQIIFNVCDKNKVINKYTEHNNNISMKDIDEISKKNSNVIADSSLKLRKKLKNAKSTSSIKLSLNQFTPSNKFSLNAIYTNINSNNKKKLNKNNDNKSLLDTKQKTQYNFNTKKSYLNEDNEKNIIINQNYYNNTITFETNNKKIEDLIIDNNFKDKLKADEIINPSNFHMTNSKTIDTGNVNINNDSLLKTTTYQQNLNPINNPINREILKGISSFNNLSLLNKEKTGTKLKEKRNNSALNIPNTNYDYPLNNNIDNNRNYIKSLISYHDDDIIKNFERIKNDTIIYYTNEYLNSINDDVLLLELNLFIDKILNLKFEYQKEYKYFLRSYIKYKNFIKYTQKKYINIMKKNNKLQTKKSNFNFSNINSDLFNLENEKLFLSVKPILDNNEKNIWNNLLNNGIIQNINDTKKKKLNNLFLFICDKNVGCLNSLAKKYYLDMKNRNKNKNKKNEKDEKSEYTSKLTNLITIQNINMETNENERDDIIKAYNTFNSKTIKNNLKTKKIYPNIKTTNRDENKKNLKNNFFLNSKSTEKKKIKKNKIYK